MRNNQIIVGMKAYITRNDVAVTLPSGYTQQSAIGYVYNNASSNFKHFWAKDRKVFCGYDDDWQVGALTSATADLVSLAGFLPPMPVVAQFSMHNGSSSNLVIGNLPATDLVTTLASEAIGSIKAYSPGAPVQYGEMVVDPYQGLMYAVSAGTLNLYVNAFEW